MSLTGSQAGQEPRRELRGMTESDLPERCRQDSDDKRKCVIVVIWDVWCCVWLQLYRKVMFGIQYACHIQCMLR